MSLTERTSVSLKIGAFISVIFFVIYSTWEVSGFFARQDAWMKAQDMRLTAIQQDIARYSKESWTRTDQREYAAVMRWENRNTAFIVPEPKAVHQ
jgi:hypothetical protein